MRWMILAAAALAAPAPALAGGNHGGGHGHDASGIGMPADPAHAARTLEIVMNDNRYDREAIEVREGETVRFVIHNRGQLVHEFNIGTPGMHHAHQEEMVEMMSSGAMTPTAMKGGHGHGSAMGHDDANSVLLEPGESAEVVWTFGADAGKLEFACNVPGHYQAGMVGSFRTPGH